jgi:hypothetical protein
MLREVEWSVSRSSDFTQEEIILLPLGYYVGWPMGPVWRLLLPLGYHVGWPMGPVWRGTLDDIYYNNKKYFFHFETSIFMEL